MPERSNGAVLKTVEAHTSVGSNPTPAVNFAVSFSFAIDFSGVHRRSRAPLAGRQVEHRK